MTRDPNRFKRRPIPLSRGLAWLSLVTMVSVAVSLFSRMKVTSSGDEPIEQLDLDRDNAFLPPPFARLLGRLTTLYMEITNDRVLAVAAGVAFYGLLAIFPTVTALVSLYGVFTDPAHASASIASLAGILPGDVMSIVQDQVVRIAGNSNSTLSFAAALSLGIALWSANAGVKAMIDSLNVAHGMREKRSFIRLNMLSLGFTLSAIVGLLLLLGAVAVVPALIAYLPLGDAAEWLIWGGRWPVLMVMLALALAVLYRWGPDVPDAKWRWISPGSAFATVGLVLLSMLFSWYAANVGKFNETYGSLGAVIAFLTWAWLGATIIIVGAELNAALDAETASAPK